MFDSSDREEAEVPHLSDSEESANSDSEDYYDEEEAVDEPIEACYPVFEDICDLLIDQKDPFDCPSEGCVVYLDWECAVLDVLQKAGSCLSLADICDALDGMWIQRSLREFIMINTTNVDFFVNKSSIKHSRLFTLEKRNVSSIVGPQFLAKDRWFVFNNDYIPLGHLVYQMLDKLLARDESVHVDVLMKSLKGRPYVTDWGALETVHVTMQQRVLYIIQMMPRFKVLGKEIVDVVKSDPIDNEKVAILKANDPLCCGLTHKQACLLLGYKSDKGKKEFLKSLASHSRVFYYNEAIGVRPEFEFKDQSKPQLRHAFLSSVVLDGLHRLGKPASLDMIMKAISGKEVMINNESTVKMGDRYRSTVAAILETMPIILCDNNRYFAMYLPCEADVFGGLYVSEARRLLSKFAGQDLNNEMEASAKKLRVPIWKDQTPFIGEIKDGVSSTTQWLGISPEERTIDLRRYKERKYQLVDVPDLFVPGQLPSGHVVSIYEAHEHELTSSSSRGPSSGPSSESESESRYDDFRDADPFTGLPLYDAISDGMPLDKAVRCFWPEDPTMRNPYHLDLVDIIKSLQYHTFDVSGVKYTVGALAEAKGIFTYALSQGREFWMTGRQKVLCVGSEESDMRYYFSSLSELVQWGLEKLHVKTQKAGVCFTFQELGEVINGKPYQHKKLRGLAMQFVNCQYFASRVVRVIHRPWSTFVCEGDKFGLIRFCPGFKDIVPVANRRAWPEAARRAYEAAISDIRRPIPEDIIKFKRWTSQLQNTFPVSSLRMRLLPTNLKLYHVGERVIHQVLDGKAPPSWTAKHPPPVPLKYFLKSKPVIRSPVNLDAVTYVRPDSTRPQKKASRERLSEPLLSSENEKVSTSSESSESETAEPEHPEPSWDPPALSFNVPNAQLCTVKPAAKKYLCAPPRIDLSAFASAPAKPSLLTALEERVRSFDGVSLDALIADLYGSYGGDKRPEDFGHDLLWELGKLQVLREQT